MNSNFNDNHTNGFRRLFLLMTTAALLASVFAGCKKQEKVPPTEPTDPPLMIDDPQIAATTAPTAETQPQAVNEPNLSLDGELKVGNTVTVVNSPAQVRNAANADGLVISTLDVGTQHEILRIVDGSEGTWLLVRAGWVCLDQPNLPDGPVGELPNNDSPEVAPPAAIPEEEKPVTPHRPSMDDMPAASDNKDKNPSSNNTNNNYNEGNGDKGVVTGSALNVRSEPSTNGKIKDTLAKGTRITILEKKDGWGRTNNGWVSLKYVYMDGATGSNTAKGVVITNGLNVRTGPGTDNKVATSYNYGTRVNILEQVNVGNTTWGATKDGWISLDYVYIDGTKGDNGGEGRITGDGLNIRSGPGTDYKAVGSLNSGDTVTILTQIKVGNTTWGCIDKGWVSMDYVDIR